MLQKKVCMLGAFSVGKTSLVRRYVSSIFEDKYLTTIGVKIDKKVVQTADAETTLMLWDIAGEDAYHSIKPSHLRGASGCIIVIDGTRPNTLEVARDIRKMALDSVGDMPLFAALNKSDLKDQWLIGESEISQLASEMTLIETSAKTGLNVEEMFSQLTEAMLR
jgi:small GTP-binding protein